MFDQSLEAIAKRMMEPGKGILAADASSETMNKRLAKIGVEEDEESRRKYRQLLFTTEHLHDYITGVILYDETIRQKTDEGQDFTSLLMSRGILPGIKVDLGKNELPYFPGEEVTEGLDGLSMRLREYYEMGARFAKWRAVVPIDTDNGLPTKEAIEANAHALARYAGICQAEHIVPMIEPEVLIEGGHSIEKSDEIVRMTLALVFEQLEKYRISLSGSILKTSMVISGNKAKEQAPAQKVAHKTVSALRDCVPHTLAGVVFLSGGQTPEQATRNLNEISRVGEVSWPMTFSYSRALQEPVLALWQGLDENVEKAQAMFLHRCHMNVLAREGKWSEEHEKMQT